MEEYLTAQEFADQLEVTRQLIYYHAKKIPKEDKVYNKENKLVFTQEQQELLKSFMTDTFDSETGRKSDLVVENKKLDKLLNNEPEGASESIIDQKRDFTYDPELAKQISMVLENEREALDKQPNDEEIQESEANLEFKQEEKMENGLSKIEDAHEITAEDEHIQAIRSYIETTVKEQLKEKWLKDEEERDVLVNELNEKNKQINDLLKLVDQQQQLMLMTEKKSNHLLETITQLKMESNIGDDYNYNHHSNKDKETDEKDNIKSKSWLQRLFS